jgi:hypothetical protein
MQARAKGQLKEAQKFLEAAKQRQQRGKGAGRTGTAMTSFMLGLLFSLAILAYSSVMFPPARPSVVPEFRPTVDISMFY